MTKTFDAICNKILGETLMTATPSPNQQKPGQPAPPPKPGQAPAPTQPTQGQQNPAIDQNRLKKITDSLAQLNDPAHLDAVEKLLAGLNTQNPNAANQQA